MFNNKKIETLQTKIDHATDLLAAHVNDEEYTGPKHVRDTKVLLGHIDQLRKDQDTCFAILRKELADLKGIVADFKKYASETGILASQTRNTVDGQQNSILNTSKRLNLLVEKQGLEFFADPTTLQLDIRKKAKIKPLDMTKIVPAGDPIANLFKAPSQPQPATPAKTKVAKVGKAKLKSKR